MTLLCAYVRTMTLELARYPSFSLPTLFFPMTLFLLFGSRGDAAARTAGFAGIAVLGVAFFQFGVGIAAERASPWEGYLRTLPVRPVLRLAGRVVSAALFALGSAACVVLAALGSRHPHLAAGRWALLGFVLLAGSGPFALLGIALGYLVRPRAALPVANLVYLPLAYVGGLWTGPRSALGGAASIVPTHQWAQLLWAAVGREPFRALPALGLAAWAGVFALVAVWGYRRDEGERFR
jgi:ABC-2 type transport system permease protein